jgi:hypothetical protein
VSVELPPGIKITAPHRLCGELPKSMERVELSALAYAMDLLRTAKTLAPKERQQRIDDLHQDLNRLVIEAVRDTLEAADAPPQPLRIQRSAAEPTPPAVELKLVGQELF